MEPRRFDTLTRSLSSRLFRRTALQAGGPGLAAAGLAAAPLRAASQDTRATPDPLSDDATFLFVQSAAQRTFAAIPGAGTASADGTPVAGGGGRLPPDAGSAHGQHRLLLRSSGTDLR